MEHRLDGQCLPRHPATVKPIRDTSLREGAVLVGFVGCLVALALAGSAVAESNGPDNPRFHVAVRSHGETVQATAGSYHCVPGEDETEPSVCHDRISGPLPIDGRVKVHGCGAVRIRTGYPADHVKVKVESKDQEVLAALGRAERLDDSRQRFRTELPKLPRSSDRFHIFVTHVDGNFGDYEAGVFRHRNNC